MAGKSRSLSFLLLICALVGAALFYGCSGGGVASDPIPVRVLQISGSVKSAVPLANIVYENNLLPDLKAQFAGAGVTVHLESDENKFTTADVNGNFVLSGLSAGTHRIVARIRTLGGKTYKVRSAPISVSESSPEVTLPQLDLKLADFTISGILKKADNTPFANARITLWGESFLTDFNGYFITPPMYEDSNEPIVIANPGYQTTTINLSFVENAPLIEQTIVANAATNRAPSATMTANKYLVDKLYDVTLRAIATDPDNDTLTYQWSQQPVNAGVFTIDVSSGTLCTWTAPNADTVATITFTAIDQAGLKAAASSMIKVGKGIVVPNSPPVITSLDVTPNDFTGGRTYQLTANATDSNGDVLTYFWSATSNASTGVLLNNNRSSISWQAPDVGPGTNTSVVISVTVNDRNENGIVSLSHTFVVMPTKPNNNPVASIEIPAGTLVSNKKYMLTASATDIDGDALTYAWSAPVGKGTIYSANSVQTEWLTPVLIATEVIQITLKVTDARNGQTTVTRNISVSSDPNVVAPTVKITSPISGTLLIASSTVSFNGVATDSSGEAILGSRMTWTEVEYGKSAAFINIGSSNFTKFYSKPATYTIELKVLDKYNIPGYSTVTFRINATPTVAITNPAPKAISQLNADLVFSATASDTEDVAILDGHYTWTFPEPAGVKTGATQTIANLPAGTQTVTLSVTDSTGGVSNTIMRQVFINQPPELLNISPASGTPFLKGTPVTFSVTASDSIGIVPAGNISWFNGATLLGTGSPIQISNLVDGINTITVRASDTMGGLIASTTSVFINTPPTMAITLPADKSAVELNQPFRLKGNGIDTAGIVDGTTMQWFDVKGATSKTLITGTDTYDFAGYTSINDFGSHTITLFGTDVHGAVGSTSIEIFVNSNPKVSISSPASGTRFDTTSDVAFVASVMEDDSTDNLTIRWYDSVASATSLKTETGIQVDGSMDVYFNTTTLASGSHTIFCEVTDMHGKQALASTAVFINTLPVSLTGDIKISTAQYATAPSNIPVFLSTDSGMDISLSVADADFELGGTLNSIENYNIENILWYSMGNTTPFATGSSVLQSFPVGYNEVTVRLYDTFYPAFEHQASATYKIAFYVWQSRSILPAETARLNGSTFMHGKGDTFYFANTANEIRTFDFVDGELPIMREDAIKTYLLNNASVTFNPTVGNGVMSDGKVIALGQIGGVTTDSLVRFADEKTPATFTMTGNMLGATSIVCNPNDQTVAYLTTSANELVSFSPLTMGLISGVLPVTGAESIPFDFAGIGRVRYAENSPSYGSRIFVADTGNDRVVRFLLNSLGKDTLTNPRVVVASSPIDMAFTQNRVLTLSNTNSELSVHHISATGTTLLMNFGGPGNGPGEFTNPIGVYLNDKDLFVLEAGRLQIIRSGELDWLK